MPLQRWDSRHPAIFQVVENPSSTAAGTLPTLHQPHNEVLEQGEVSPFCCGTQQCHRLVLVRGLCGIVPTLPGTSRLLLLSAP